MQQDKRRKKESMGTHKELPSSWQQDRRQDKDKKKQISKLSWARLWPWQQDKKRREEKQQGSQDKESHEQLGSP